MNEFQTTLGPVVQHGYIVADIDAEMARWSAEEGVGPWMVIRSVRLKCEYLGMPSDPLIDVALSYKSGEEADLQIELIQQHNKEPSPYRAMIESGEYGLHHQAWMAEDISAAIATGQAAGLQLVCDIHAQDGARYAYLADEQTGNACFIELLQSTWLLRAMMRQGQAASQRWQGQAANIEIDLNSIPALLASLPSAAVGWWRQR